MPSAADPVGPLRPPIQQTIDRFLEGQRELLGRISTELVPLADAAADLLRGGKRLRPAFCYWGWRAAGDSVHDDDVVITTGAALELFQAAALVHDDVIDDSDTRRGHPSVHRRFATRHVEAGWHGDPAGFGRATAILLGDLLLGWSDELFDQAKLSDGVAGRARPVFEQMRTEVGAGQYLDILAQADTTQSPADQVERARRVIVHKSARYSVQHPLVMGGRIADAGEQLIAEYSTYGAALGEAFQLRDDVLGVFGDPAETGKPAGDDLREGKRTVLIAYARERASRVQAETLDSLLGDRHLDMQGVARLREILTDTQAVGRVEARIAELIAVAEAALKRADLRGDGYEALTALITLATTRTS
jgi:geranylgeranyl diphosphate synthase, type I